MVCELFKVLLPQTKVTLAEFGSPVVGPLIYLLHKIFKLLIVAFRSFDHEHTWWRLLHKRLVHTKLDIHVLLVVEVIMVNWL
jgi:hypothetical protein